MACAFNSFCSYSFGSGDWNSSRAACSLHVVKCQKIRDFTGVCCVRRMDVVLIRTGFSFCTFRLPPLTYKLAFGSDYYSFGCNQPIIFFFHTKSAPTSASQQYFFFITNQYQSQPIEVYLLPWSQPCKHALPLFLRISLFGFF